MKPVTLHHTLGGIEAKVSRNVPTASAASFRDKGMGPGKASRPDSALHPARPPCRQTVPNSMTVTARVENRLGLLRDPLSNLKQQHPDTQDAMSAAARRG